MTAPSPSLLNAVKVIALKKVLLVIHKIQRVFFNTFIVDEKHYLLHRDNLTQPILIQLSRKQKTFSQFFLAF